MKSAVPGKIVDPGGGFEEDDGRACRRRRLARNFFCGLRNFEIVEPADQSALDALSVEFWKHGEKFAMENRFCPPILSANFAVNSMPGQLGDVQFLPDKQCRIDSNMICFRNCPWIDIAELTGNGVQALTRGRNGIVSWVIS